MALGIDWVGSFLGDGSLSWRSEKTFDWRREDGVINREEQNQYSKTVEPI